MKKIRKLKSLFLLLLVNAAVLLGGCGKSSYSTNLPTKELPDNWKVEKEGLVFDGASRNSFFITSEETENQDFRYATDISFEKENLGIASLVFQSSDDGKSCYKASIDARTDKAQLTKWEHGIEVSLGNAILVEDKKDYHLQINMIGSHIAFFVDDELICSTGDYVVSPDFGQDDVLLSGKLGLFSGNGKVTYQNTYYKVYEENEMPVLAGITVTPQNGALESDGGLFENGWYVCQQYVSADCSSASIIPEAADGVETVILCNDTGETVSGTVNLREGQNHFQIYTVTKDKEGGSYRQLSYRLHILRRGTEEYYTEDYRGQYHYSVKEGWANDPNGLVKLGDTYHMFYQFYPEGTDWGPMHWAHATSTDLIHWEEKGITFYPNEYGTMFSGCAVIDEKNVSGLFDSDGGIIAFITANGNGQRIIAAYSKDGDQWEYYRGKDANGVLDGNDVLIDWADDELLSQAFRDPKVFKYQDTYFMVIAGGKLRIYSSTNLLDWKLESSYGDRPNNSSNLKVETECPDLYRLPIEGEDGWKWVLSYGGRRYQIGDFAKVDGKWEFIPDADYVDNLGVMNFGNDSYAAMTYYISPSFQQDTQERVISYNWMNSWDYCTAVDDFTGNKRFNGTFNLNLEMSLTRDADGRLMLKQTPIKEYTEYVFPEENIAVEEKITVGAEETKVLEGFSGDSYQMEVALTPEDGTTKASVLVRVGKEHYTSVEYEFATDTLTVNRGMNGTQLSSAMFQQVVTEKKENGTVILHIYVDRASIEVFSADYTAACGLMIFPEKEDTGISFSAAGGGCGFAIKITMANSIWGTN